MRLRLVAASAASVLLLTACSSGGPGGSNDEPPKPVKGRVSPLTGEPQEQPPNNRAFMVKIENTEGGQPQYGLNHADFVIEELVEGGLTRLAAFFYSDLPTKVGHVRSSRTTDIGLSKPVGATVVASGGAPKTLDAIKSAHVPIYTYDAGSPGYSKDPTKNPPYHVLWDLKKLDAAVDHGVIPTVNYFDWGSGPAPSDGKPVTSASVQFSPGTTTKWTFSGGKWTHTPNHAAPGEVYKADTVVVIFARVADAGYKDPAGNPVPETIVEGSGRAVILSGGTAVEGTWHKAGLGGTMKFTSSAGKPITIKPGHVFLEAAPRGGSITF